MSTYREVVEDFIKIREIVAREKGRYATITQEHMKK